MSQSMDEAPKRSTRAPRHCGTIVKVQMSPTDLTADALIYDGNREHQVFVPQTTYLRRKMAGEAKAFFYAKWNGAFWVLGNPAAWQPW